MKPSKLPKDKANSVRYNSEVEKKLKERGYKSIQDFLNRKIDNELTLEFIDEQIVLDN